MKFTIIGMAGCNYCDKARDLIKSTGIKGDYFELTRAALKDLGYKTAPAIYVNDKYIGGYTEMREIVIKHSTLLLEALRLHGVEQWEGFEGAQKMVNEWMENFDDK